MPNARTILNSSLSFCWLSAMPRPLDWHGAWGLHVAHIHSGGGKAVRRDDRRAVILLSPLAHEVHVSDADRYPSRRIGGREWPTIDERHTLWLKENFDREYFDPEYLESIWIGKLPARVRPSWFWESQFLSNTGRRY